MAFYGKPQGSKDAALQMRHRPSGRRASGRGATGTAPLPMGGA